jgi:thymidylate synthase
MNRLDTKYQDLLQDILDNGVEKSDRTNTGTISVFGRQIRHNMKQGFPLLTTKKMAIKTMMTELKWFLKGDTNIKYLVDNGCNIWNGDAYAKYCKAHPSEYQDDMFSQEEFIEHIKEDESFAKNWGNLGPIYGKQWRKWKGKLIDKSKEFNAHTAWVPEQIDQIAKLIVDLKKNPDSRRLMVSAWNVGEIDEMTLPPCHYGFQVYTRELSLEERIDIHNTGSISKSSDFHHEHMDINEVPRRAISLMWNQRSVDTFLGLPFNIASYGMLLHLLAEEVGMIPGEIIGNLGDVHLYSNHIEQAQEQISREPKPYLPKLKLSNVDILNGEFDYEILHYQSHPTIKAPLSN